MAYREGQAIRVALVVFSMVVVMLIGGCIYFSNSARALQTQRATLEQENRRLSKKARSFSSENQKLKTFLGYRADAKLKTIRANFNRHMLLFGEEVPTVPEELNYPKLPKYYQVKLREIKYDLKDQQAQHNDILAVKNAAIKAGEGKLVRLTNDRDNIIAVIKDEIDLNTAQVAEHGVFIEGIVADVDQERRRNNEKMRLVRGQLATAEENLDRAGRINEVLHQKVRRLSPKNIFIAKADGKVISISSELGRVTLDMGSQDGLRRQTTFNVYDADISNVATAKVKARIEVTRVDAASAEARILQENYLDPILTGDQVYTVAWQPGQKLRFALAGKMDFDGDGLCDQKRLRDMIEKSGSIVEGYVDGDGNTHGSVTQMAAFLVTGQRPTEKSKKDARATFTQFSKMATDNAVDQMPAERFIQRMGWSMGQRAVIASH